MSLPLLLEEACALREDWLLGRARATRPTDAGSADVFTQAAADVGEASALDLLEEVGAGWSRELWIQSLGVPAVLPPPKEEKDVKTAIGAARAKQERDRMRAS